MNKTAFIYPGQGAQAAGMGKDFYDNSPLAREIYNMAEEATGLDIKALCFEENDRLDNTEYTQPALVTTCLAMTRVYMEKTGIKADMTAGLSLGEYPAISVAGGLSDRDAIALVKERGKLMEHALPKGTTGMAAVLGMTGETVEAAIDRIENVTVANYNCPGQIVITGENTALIEAGKALKEAGAKRVLTLNVSGAFHSPMLKEAGIKLGEKLESVKFGTLDIPYVSNVTAREVGESSQSKELLVKQISSSVLWEQSMEYMIEAGIDTFVEIGPGRTLNGFLRKINRDVKVINISKWEDLHHE